MSHPLGADSRTVENMCYALYDQGHSGRAIVRELFFRTEDNNFNVAGYTVKGDSLVADKPRVRSEKSIANLGLTANFDLAPDGKRIAALMPTGTPEDQKGQNQLIFLENFFDEVRRRTATQAK